MVRLRIRDEMPSVISGGEWDEGRKVECGSSAIWMMWGGERDAGAGVYVFVCVCMCQRERERETEREREEGKGLDMWRGD